MAAVFDDLGLEVGELLSEVIVERLRFVEFVEGVEVFALSLELLGGLHQQKSPIPDVGRIEAVLRAGG